MFAFPKDNKDLLIPNENSYYVKQVLSVEQLPEAMRACETFLKQNNPFYLIANFDAYYSLLENENWTDTPIVQMLLRAFDMLVVTTLQLRQQLQQFLSQSEEPPLREQQELLKLTKMLMYLLIRVVEKIVGIFKQQGVKDNWFTNWKKKFLKFFILLRELMQFDLKKLWSPAKIETNFLSLVTHICYDSLKNFRLAADEQNILGNIFHILGNNLVQYKYGNDFLVCLLRIVCDNEDVAPYISSGISIIFAQYRSDDIVPTLLQPALQYFASETAKDEDLTNIGELLTSLSRLLPETLLRHLTMMKNDIKCLKSPELLINLLQILSIAVVLELAGKNLQFLEDLLTTFDDFHDGIQIAIKQANHLLQCDNIFPLQLKDKESKLYVESANWIMSFLSRYPWAVFMVLKSVVKLFDQEYTKMKQLENVQKEMEKLKLEAVDNWDIIEQNISCVVRHELAEIANCTQDVIDIRTSIRHQVGTLLKQQKYKESIQILRKAYGSYDKNKNVSKRNNAAEHKFYMKILKDCYFDAHNDNTLTSELLKSTETVVNLMDCVHFTELIGTMVRDVFKNEKN